jgi:hypothetical protein
MLNNHSRTPNILSVIFVTPFLSFSISPVPHHPSNRMSYFLFCLGNCRHLVRKCHKLPYPPLDLIPPFSPRLCVLLSSGSPFFFLISVFLFGFSGNGVGTQEFLLTKQAVYHLSYTSSPTTIFKYLHHLWRHCKTTWVEWTDSAPIPSPCSKNQTTGFFNGQSTLKCSAVVPVTLDHVGKGHIFVYFSPAVPSCIL